jgi:hypothetical protein
MKTLEQIQDLANGQYMLPPNASNENKGRSFYQKSGYCAGYQDGQQHGMECAKAETADVAIAFAKWVLGAEVIHYVTQQKYYVTATDDEYYNLTDLFNHFITHVYNGKTV